MSKSSSTMYRQIALNTGAKMPMIGLGTWKSKPGEVKAAVEAAIDAGYRHVDCAFYYGNESEVGEAIQNKIKERKVERKDLFVTTKLWNTYYSPKRIRECLNESLKRLKLDYVDLYLMHWPFALQFSEENLIPMDAEGKTLNDEDIDYVDVWKEMEKINKEGLAKAVGVCNFNKNQLKRVIDEGSIVPAVNQYECHPYLHQEDLLKFCQSNGVVVTGYSPFGSPDRPWAKPNEPGLLDDPNLLKIAKKYGKSVAHVILRYQIQRDIVVIPKSVTASRIKSNFDVFDFCLSKEDESEIRKMERNWRALPMDFAKEHKYFPFRENYRE